MKAGSVLMVGGSVLLAMLGAPGLSAQEPPPSAPPQVQAAHQFAPAELDQMLAPIALYPDPLMGQILMAATYPVEVVEADRWLQDPNNAALKGDRLSAALEQQNWDPSVKSLVPFPQVLHMMDGNLEWTERLGEAFLADQAAVMDSVQRLRQRAQAAGRLQSTPQETVQTEGQAITIEPPTPETVYVPVYDPGVVFGPWPYPDFPPFYFPDFFGGVVIGAFGFGWFGVPIIGPFWGWNHWDWAHHRIDIDRERWAHIDHGRPPVLGPGGGWAHDLSHRRDVPYRDAGVRGRFQSPAGAPDAVRVFRGYSSAPAAPRPAPSVGGQYRPPEAIPHAPPSFESFGRGAEVRAQAERGQASRMSMPSGHSSAPAGGGRGHR